MGAFFHKIPKIENDFLPKLGCAYKMSGKGAALRRAPEFPEYELDTSKNYQLVFVKFDEIDYEFEALQIFEERMNEAVRNGYFPLGAPVCHKQKYSEYYMFQGILKQNR